MNLKLLESSLKTASFPKYVSFSLQPEHGLGYMP